MGMSYTHEVYFICEKDESEYVNTLPERLPGDFVDVPVYDKKVDGNVVSFSSWGYNIYSLFTPEFPRPDSWVGCVHRISPCQSQEFDVVDWVPRSEIDEKVGEMEDEDDTYLLREYTDPQGDYWEENEELNPYSTPFNYDDMDDDDDTKYMEYLEKIDTDQQTEVEKGVTQFLNQVS